MKILITGGSGFIGSKLTEALLAKGHEVVIFDLVPPPAKHPRLSFGKINLVEEQLLPGSLEGVSVVFHLAGRSIFGKWNEQMKKEIYESRVKSAENLVSAIRKLQEKPKAYITASAVGYYGKGFLARVCKDWEAAAAQLTKENIRVVAVRTAPVIGRGGMLAQLLPLYKLGLGGPVAGGMQWFPWIHINDLVRIYIFCMEHENIRGAVNAAAPEHVRQKGFSRTLASLLHRPAFLPAPKWALRLRFGEFADSILESQKISSKKIQGYGFRFAFPSLEQALKHTLKQ